MIVIKAAVYKSEIRLRLITYNKLNITYEKFKTNKLRDVTSIQLYVRQLYERS